MAARNVLARFKLPPLGARIVATDEATMAFYEREARRYAKLTLRMSMAPQLAEFLRACPTGRILDLGCGAGRDLRDMSAQGRDVLGLDRSHRLAVLARSVSGAPVVVADLLRPPISSGVLAGIWSSASLLHLPREQVPYAISEASRMLRPGGVMFSSVKAGRGEQQADDGRRFVFHELGAWGDLFERAGFRLLSLAAPAVGPTATSNADVWINCLAQRG